MHATRIFGVLLLGLIFGLPARSQNISTVAGSSTWGRVLSVRLDAAGNFYVPDSSNQVIYKIDASGTITIVAGTPRIPGFSGDGGPATSALLRNPFCVTPAPDGSLYICDYGNSRIRKVALNGTITTYAGTATQGFSGDGGPAASAQLSLPFDIVIDAAGNLFFSDSRNYRIRKITADGIINTVAGSGSLIFSGDGASALQAGMVPSALALGNGGSFYFVDNAGFANNHRVRQVAANGIITTVAGNGTETESGDGGPATAAGLASPSGVAFDSGGNLYISDQSTSRIRKVSPAGIITTYAGTGTPGFSGDGGPAIKAQLLSPQGLSVDASGNLYIADSLNQRIRKISVAPAISAAGLVNGASFVSGGVVPGEIATIFGTNLTTATGINLAPTLPLATQLLNVQVLVNGTPAPLFAVDNVGGLQQINFQVPFEVENQPTAAVQVMNNAGASNVISVSAVAAQPGIFSYAVGSSSFGAILHGDLPNPLADTGHPAAAGEIVLIFCTGLGDVAPTPPDGAAATGAASTTATPTVTIGGQPAAVSYSGLAPGFVGLYQINAQVPSGLAAGNQPVIITIGSAQSSIALLPVQ